ncbi:hypothetical protein HOI26_04475 [Candidatus Woesearchaeota archaeon]|jgi:uncharacterized membrane protein|nr:hypothetical protein [Candidatus Woesearchaeota archaeon]MBT5740325.1 hypothetical protein [Candidatus Woesearchaeota archaeon]
MKNKKVGILLFAISISLLIVFILLINSLQNEAEAIGCFEQQGCQQIETSLSIVHFAFGVFGFLFALSFYLFFFSKGEEAIVRRLERDTSKKLNQEKFNILLMGMDKFEKEVMQLLREEDSITQNTLRLKVQMSKAKLSQTLTNLEKKNLIVREKLGKTMKVQLK